MQLVRLFRNGEIARMSKRTGKSVTLTDLLEETSIDAARFFFNLRQAGSHLDFDLDLAVSKSNENPVYYVQYAHARICSMIEVLKQAGVNTKPSSEIDFSVLKEAEEIELLKKLVWLPDEIRNAAVTMEPSKMTRYVMDLAALFHSFYNACKVKGEDQKIMDARLKLVDSVRIVIANVLAMIGISAPEKM